VPRRLALAALLAAAGCATAQPRPAVERADVIWRVRPAAEVQARCAVRGLRSDCLGYAVWDESARRRGRVRGLIVTVAPGEDRCLSIVGHEWRHLVEGHWHR